MDSRYLTDSLRSSTALPRVLVVAEKPDAARKIASALGKAESRKIRGTEILVVDSASGTKYYVCSALGHLYELSDPGVDRGIWPVFDIEWFVKSGSTSRFRKHSGRESQALAARLDVIGEISKEASAVVNACDYDLEGETIGSNIIQFA
ncbi:MAG: hypothetical protein JRN20_23345, partial [Nitrososphaerota archaeon]|nr:hypothetical protein [Nitrososphaerota archaeon]